MTRNTLRHTIIVGASLIIAGLAFEGFGMQVGGWLMQAVGAGMLALGFVTVEHDLNGEVPE